MHSFFLGKRLGVELLSHMIVYTGLIWETANLFSKVTVHFTLSPEVYKGSWISTSSPTYVIVCLMYYSPSGGWASLVAQMVKNLPAMRETTWVWSLGLIPGLGKSPGEVNGNLLQYSCLENPMDRGAWGATVHWVANSLTRLRDWELFVCLGRMKQNSFLIHGYNFYWRSLIILQKKIFASVFD